MADGALPVAPAAAPPGAPPPGTPPLAAPQGLVQEGLKARAYLQAGIARKLLEQALPIVGSVSEEGKAIISALNSLKKLAPTPATAELSETEVEAMRPGAGPGPAAGPAPGTPPAAPGLTPSGPTPAMMNFG